MRYVIDRQMAWLCIGFTFAAGLSVGFALGVLVVL